MTALVNERMSCTKTFGILPLTLKSGTKAYKNGLAALVLGEGVVAPGTAATGRVAIGTFTETVDATAAAKTVGVELQDEITATWLHPHTSGAPVATDVGRVCYVQDDQTVTMTATARSQAGRVWAVSGRGVLVQFLGIDSEYLATLLAPVDGATLAFTAGDVAVTAPQFVHESWFACPATDAASTITLATTGVDDGTRVYFVFDGTANDYPVTVRYGTTNITPPIPANTAALVTCVKQGSAWVAIVTALPVLGATLSFVANDAALTAAQCVNGASFAVPATSDASTVTLPAAGVAEGTKVSFVADGTNNAHTVQYRDDGPVNLTTALTALKRHHVVAEFRGGAWACTADVAP